MEPEGEGEIPEASTIIQVEDEEEKEQGVAADKVATGDNVPLIPSPLFIRGLYPDLSQQLQVSVTVIMKPNDWIRNQNKEKYLYSGSGELDVSDPDIKIGSGTKENLEKFRVPNKNQLWILCQGIHSE